MHSLTDNQAATRSRVHRALAGLPDQDRVLIEHIYWSGLSSADIAAELGIPLRLVKARMRAALTRLADLLAD
jgi:RNA polymerase sigma-70 factor (ECF subfamily)